MKCPECGSAHIMKNGTRRGKQNYQCGDCKKYFVEGSAKVTKRKNNKMGISTEDFRKKHDVVYIITQVLEGLDGDMFYEKSDIIQMSGLSVGYPGIGTVLDSAELKKYKGRAGSRDYWAKPELIKKLTEEGIMR